jgi:putative membrane protein
MSRIISRLFSENDLRNISDAVKQAESKTSGEIIPYVVETSDEYEESIWRGGFVAAMLAFIPFAILYGFTDVWLPSSLTAIAVPFLAGGAVMGILWLAPPLRVLLTDKKTLRRRVVQRATEAFLAEEVFRTRDRSGILIFLSLMEHEVVVMGDAGITAKVEQSRWDEIAKVIVDGMKAGKPTQAITEAILKSGALLLSHGLTRRADDADELADRLRSTTS